MPGLSRFGISISRDLLQKFDMFIREKKYPNRSKAIADLVRQELIKEEWCHKEEITGAITLLYDHHKRELLCRITDIPHDFQKIIISTQHIHLDHDKCLEIAAIKCSPLDAQKLLASLKAVKGVKHAPISMSSTGKIFRKFFCPIGSTIFKLVTQKGAGLGLIR